MGVPMTEMICSMGPWRVVTHLEQLANEKRFDELAQSIAVIPIIPDECNPDLTLDNVMGKARSVEVIKACLAAGGDPNRPDGLPAFYTVLSDEAAAFLKPLTKMLSHDERSSRTHGTDLFKNIFDDDESDPYATDEQSLQEAGNSLAVHEIVENELLGIPSAIKLHQECLRWSNSADHARGLIECGANPFVSEALFHQDNAEVVAYLCSVGVDAKHTTYGGRTALHSAQTGEVATVLIQYGADVNATDDEGETPLHTAHSADVVGSLVQAGANLKARAKGRRTALHSLKSGEVVKALIKAGANPNARDSHGDTPLHYMCYGFNYEDGDGVRHLIEAGADVNATNHKGLGVLGDRYKQSPDVLRVVLDGGYNPLDKPLARDGGTILHCALKYNTSCALIHRIIDLGVDVNAQDVEGHTALHLMVLWGYKKRLNWLFQKKADPLIADNEGYLPVDLATCDEVREMLNAYMARRQRTALKRSLGHKRTAVAPGTRRRM